MGTQVAGPDTLSRLMLTPLQERVARLVADVPEAADFALAGGAALIVHGVIDRQTRDLDLFATAAAHVSGLLPVIERRLVEDGLSVLAERFSEGFARLTVADGSASTVVDLAWDYRLRPPVRTPLGNVVAEDELAADKTLALFGRAEARDFVDMKFLTGRYSLDQLCELAFEKDRGFTRQRLAEAMRRFDRLDAEEFGLDAAAYRQLAAEVGRWRRSLAPSVAPRTPPGLGL